MNKKLTSFYRYLAASAVFFPLLSSGTLAGTLEDLKKDIKVIKEIEVSLNVDLQTANSMIKHFDLENYDREDFYMNVYKNGRYILDGFAFRLKHYPEKSKTKLQIAQKESGFAKCGRYTLKTTSKTKLDKTLRDHESRNVTRYFNKSQKEILDSSIETSDLEKFQKSLFQINHPGLKVIKENMPKDSIVVPTKRSEHVKYSNEVYVGNTEVKISVGKTSDFIYDRKVSERFDLEFSGDSDDIEMSELFEAACEVMTGSYYPRVKQLPSIRTAEQLTRKRLLEM